jgi:hypothetical protein
VQKAVDLFAELVMERLINTPPGLLPEPLDQTASKRTVVHTATGVVSEQLGVPVSQALDVLRAHSWAAEGDLYQIAAEVVGGTIRFEPQPASPEDNQSA